MTDLSIFSGKYSMSKTLRFELIPVGDTLAHIQEKGIIDADTALAESYKKMKKTIDSYHRSFIDRTLSEISLSNLDSYYALYMESADRKNDKAFADACKAARDLLRREIVKAFEASPDYKLLDKKELIQKRLKQWIDDNAPELYFNEQFINFTTYFTGYNQNRMNMYSDEEKATAVAYRLINENLPKFIDNLNTFKRLSNSPVADCFPQLCIDMEPWLNVSDLSGLFSLHSYSKTLTQPQIDAYNTLIGGRSEGDRKVKGLNEYINLYNQSHPDNKLPKLKILYKQILSEHESASRLPEVFETGNELLDSVNTFYREKFSVDNADCTVQLIKTAIEGLPSAELGKIYIGSAALSTISQKLFGYYGLLSAAMGIETDNEEGNKSTHYSIADIQSAVDKLAEKTDREASPELFSAYSTDCITAYFVSGMTELLAQVQSAYGDAERVLNASHGENYRLSKDETALIKKLLDAMMDVLHLVKPLYLSADAMLESDEVFYGAFSGAYEEFKSLTSLYDKVRNFVTKKPYSTEKIKLNFSCSTFLSGWDINKEAQNLGVLFLKDSEYYLGIMDKANNRLFTNVEPADSGECYQKVMYKLLPGPNKMLPKVFFSKSRIDEFEPSEEIMRIYKSGAFKKGPAFSVSDCHKLIDFFKSSIEKHSEWCNFDFDFSPTEQYADISEFYREISEQGYKLTFKQISANYVDSLVREGKLYLFKIHNKDFSPNAKGRPNLHTMYWKALFDEENLRDVVYKLNGEAEVFYRKASIAEKDRVIHSAGQPISKKNPSLSGQSSTFDYDIVKDRRYTVDKFQFHVPITMNFKAGGTARINDDVCSYLKNNPDVKIIGIDRGERHLLYISMIDRSGKVVKDKNGNYIQYSLNTISGEYKDSKGAAVSFSTPYHELLDKKEKERDEARKSWSTIESIKELKAGYMSQVVHHIARLMVEYNAIVVLEDLNAGFKNGRKKVEKQVYQNFEKALIEKLNYLVFKDVPADEPGGLYRALQLTNKFESFRNLTKQSGFLFYVSAWNTSKIDPVTGFVDMLKPKTGMSVKEAKQFFSRFDRIEYNHDKDWFEFEFDYASFTAKAEGTRTKWIVCTHGELRYAFNRKLNNNRGGYEKWNVTERMKELFDKSGIDYRCGDLRAAISAQKSAGFFASLIKLLQVTLAMRYSSAEDGKDFILSPVADKNGEFYCSEGRCDGLPQDADANGAYNIARKGLLVLRQIDKAEKYGDWTTKISNKDWLSFVQTEL